MLFRSGIEVIHKKNIMIANTVNEFTKAVSDLNDNEDLYNSLIVNGKELILNKYSIDTIGNQLKEVVNTNGH